MHLLHQHPTTGRVVIIAVLFHIHPREQDNTFVAKILRRVPAAAGGSNRVNNTVRGRAIPGEAAAVRPLRPLVLPAHAHICCVALLSSLVCLW